MYVKGFKLIIGWMVFVFGEVVGWSKTLLYIFCAGELDLIALIRLVGVMISLLLFVVLQHLPKWHCKRSKWSQS